MGDSTTGRFRLLANSRGTFGTEVTISASVVGDTGSVVVTDDNIIVTGLSYTEFQCGGYQCCVSRCGQ